MRDLNARIQQLTKLILASQSVNDAHQTFLDLSAQCTGGFVWPGLASRTNSNPVGGLPLYGYKSNIRQTDHLAPVQVGLC